MSSALCPVILRWRWRALNVTTQCGCRRARLRDISAAVQNALRNGESKSVRLWSDPAKPVAKTLGREQRSFALVMAASALRNATRTVALPFNGPRSKNGQLRPCALRWLLASCVVIEVKSIRNGKAGRPPVYVGGLRAGRLRIRFAAIVAQIRIRCVSSSTAVMAGRSGNCPTELFHKSGNCSVTSVRSAKSA